MEFRRVTGLPPYVFGQINGLKAVARANGHDVIDFGFGNPDLPSPDVAVEKLAEAAHNPKNHRYSASRGIPNLRLAIANRYKMLFDVDLDPDSEVVTTIGAKEGFTHLMWVLLGPGDSAIVPSPSYPIHLAVRASPARTSSRCPWSIPARARTTPVTTSSRAYSRRGARRPSSPG
jgi:alanine-synthesizing transaminase